MSQIEPGALTDTMAQEIQRFVATTAHVGKTDLDVNRRAATRYHRSLPLLVARLDGEPSQHREYSVTLADVSTDGLGFYCDTGFRVGSILGVRLGQALGEAIRIPAIVCHNLITSRGVLVGARFAADHPDACDLVESWNPGHREG